MLIQFLATTYHVNAAILTGIAIHVVRKSETIIQETRYRAELSGAEQSIRVDSESAVNNYYLNSNYQHHHAESDDAITLF